MTIIINHVTKKRKWLKVFGPLTREESLNKRKNGLWDYEGRLRYVPGPDEVKLNGRVTLINVPAKRSHRGREMVVRESQARLACVSCYVSSC